MSVSGSQVATFYQRQARVLGEVASSYRQLIAELSQADVKLAEQLALARRELAAVYLPRLDDESLARVVNLAGFQGFARRDPRSALAHERHVLQQSLARADGDPRYANRDADIARISAEIASSRETLAPLDLECQRFETLLGFAELVEIGYDTPAFAEKWWHASYWKHWATGDRICKALDLNDFGDDVLPAYKEKAEPRNYMRDEIKKLEAQIDAIHELVRERDRVADRLAHLEEIYLAEAQQYLGEHLEHADAALLEQWAAVEPDMLRAVQMGLRKIAGITAKRRFVTEIGTAGLPQVIGQLEQRAAKAQQKQGKFARPKNAYATFPSHMVAGDFDQKMEGMQTQRDKLSRRVQTLVAAENYGGFDLRNDQELWWLYLMQSPPPRFAPSLYDYYQRRPNAQPMIDPDYVEVEDDPGVAQAAVAYAAGELEQGGAYLS
jgi:hypothetical protein